MRFSSLNAESQKLTVEDQSFKVKVIPQLNLFVESRKPQNQGLFLYGWQ
ncbi:MAG: hypothetical protein QOJ02_2458 [Acidobacteriota bacterium]|jgi:hypothetical protein|nr:hypothetical protein [Acidobacteriota bacterium]